MAPYDIAASADCFAGSVTFFHALVGVLTGAETATLPHDQVEDLLEERGRELLRQLFQDHLDLRAAREEQTVLGAGKAVFDAEGLPHARVEAGHSRPLATIFGTVTVTRCAFRAAGARNLYPADAVLSLPVGRHSHGLRRLAVIEAVRGSFDTAKEAITRRCGPVIGKRQIEDLIQAAAADIDAFYQDKVFPPCTADTLLILSADAKGILMRPQALRPATAKAATKAKRTFRTRLASGEKPGRKRMATLGAVHDCQPAPRRPHDVIAIPGGRHGDRDVRPGPKATGTWLSASVVHDTRHVIGQVFDHAEDRDPGHARTWVMLVDGARHQLEVIQTEARRRRIDLNIVIDIVHVLEYLWQAAWCLHPAGDPAAEDWVATHALTILAGNAARAAHAIDTQTAHLDPDQRRGAAACTAYLTSKQQYMRYDQALEHGWPIATGVIEGAARHIVADRFDIAGARWGLAGAEAILKLRTLTANNDLSGYWRHHLTQEHHRTHQTRYQNDYQLTA